MKNKALLIPILIGFMLSIVTMMTACDSKNEQTTATSKTQSPISFENLYAVLPPPVANGTSVYGTIKNMGKKSDTLIDLSSNAGMVMLHQSVVEEGNAEMIHIDSYEIKPNEALVLKPMSYHIMLMNINHDIVKKGGKIKLSFNFKEAGLIELLVPVEEQ